MRTSGPRISLAVIALVLVALVGDGLGLATEAAAAHPWHRVHSYDLATDIGRAELSWTSEPRLPLPHPRPRDANGVPMYRVDGQLYYRPGALAISGMKRLDAYHDKRDGRQLKQALKQARKLRQLAIEQRGAWWLTFDYDYLPAGMRAPWVNAMTQGLVLSFFMRLYAVTGKEVHLDAAQLVFRSFLRPQREGKLWVTHVDPKGYLWLEHYPRSKPSHVLNAHLHALFGIYEYWAVTKAPKARRLIKAAITTMRHYIPRFRRAGGYSLYDLVNRTRIRKYHQIHVWQLRLLARISGDTWFWSLADRFVEDYKPRGYVPGRPARRVHPPWPAMSRAD